MSEPRYETLPDVVGWVVFDSQEDSYWLEDFAEAEAKIIVFALNAVAEGLEIHAERVEHGGGSRKWHVCARRYNGPTEGVAP